MFSAHFVMLLLQLAIPLAPQTITISSGTIDFAVTFGTQATAAEVTNTDCDTLMAQYNALVDQADQFERSAGQYDNGDACDVFQEVPSR